ncbi:anti-phage defense ZorAB system protein ZorA [bacterium BD-1]|nr:anti-phage defense ZorAB system protein ZorA [Ottowia caeni]
MNFDFITDAPIHLLVSGSVLLLLVAYFFLAFFFPGLRHRSRLGSLLTALNSEKYKKVLNPEQLGSAFDIFPKSDQIQHLWREHKKTLYSTSTEQGGVESSRWHATVSAESLWNGQLAVDGRLKTDFFKHLPGIFTGLGIIGTFLGLIAGLRQFKVSSEADVVRTSLEALMHSVGEAFLISAAAIGAAMVVTFLEKMLLSSLYRKVDSIAEILDARFPYSAPEDILKKTEGYAEESATQLKQLKTELVKELRPVLLEMSEAQSKTLERLTASLERRFEHVGQSQIEASRANNTELGTAISQAIASGLSAPLDEIKDAVKKASGDQSQTAVNMLQDVMTSFSQKLNDLFGGQINGINDLNQRTADTMQMAVGKLSELVESLQTAGKSSTEAMAEHMARALSDMEARQSQMASTTQALVDELKQAIVLSQSTTKDSVETATSEMARRMAEAIEKMELRQSAINETNKEFISQIKGLVSTSQSETNSKLQEVLGNLEVQLGHMLASFQAIQAKAVAEGQAREQANSEKTQAVVGSMVGSVEGLVGKISDATAQMQASVATLATTTTTAIDSMSNGAQLVNAAAQSFSNASDKVTNAMGQAGTVSSKLTDVSASLATASSAIQASVGDYRLHREAVGSMVEELRGVIANAKTDVGISSSVLQRIEQASTKLSQAQLQTEQFLNGVAVVLGKAHEEFRASVTNSLSKSNHEFQQKLASAVGMLSASIKELDDVLATATPRGHKA